jgi:hypothetical protein
MSFLPILDVIGKVVDKVIPDPNQRMQLQIELSKLADQEAAREAQITLQQIEVNKIEAANSNLFVAGWRPAIGWVGALSLFTYYPVQIIWQLVEFGAIKLDVTDLIAIIGGLLGFSGMRTYEKKMGVAAEGIPAPTAPVAEKKGPKILPKWLR